MYRKAAVGFGPSEAMKKGARAALKLSPKSLLAKPGASSRALMSEPATITSSRSPHSPTEAWAVGESSATPTSQQRALIEHFDGSKWNVVSSPTTGQLSDLGGVAAISPSDVWATGSFFNVSGNQQMLVEHWNGFQMANRAGSESRCKLQRAREDGGDLR